LANVRVVDQNSDHHLAKMISAEEAEKYTVQRGWMDGWMNIPLVGWCNAHDDSLASGGGALLSHVRVHLAPAGNPGSRSGYDHQKFSSPGAQLPHACSTSFQSFQSSDRNLHA